jgi:hypothetical protein
LQRISHRPLSGKQLRSACCEGALMKNRRRLTVGTYHITASYSGDSRFASSSTLVPLTLIVNPTSVGPRVIGVDLYGDQGTIAAVAIRFDHALDRVRARIQQNYRLLDLNNGNRADIGSIGYDAGLKTVALNLEKRLSMNNTYLLFVRGTRPDGLTSGMGVYLDGTGTGHPGANYTAILKAGRLTLKPLLTSQ